MQIVLTARQDLQCTWFAMRDLRSRFMRVSL